MIKHVGRDGERVAFVVERAPKRPGRWQLLRCSIECYETGYFATADEAKQWASRLNPRVAWSVEKELPK